MGGLRANYAMEIIGTGMVNLRNHEVVMGGDIAAAGE